MSLRRTGVPESLQPLRPDNVVDRDFRLTLLESPPLLVSLPRQISCWWQERRASSPPETVAPLPLVDTRPWFQSLPEQVRAMWTAAKAAPAVYSSTPVDVPNIWQDYLPDPRSWANSLLVHALVLTALVLPFALRPLFRTPPPPQKLLDLSHVVLTLPVLQGHAEKTGGGGSGGDRSPLPASRGALPTFARMQLAPPMVKIPKGAALPVAATLIGPPELKLPAMKLDMPFGDPSAAVGPPSQGPGQNGGIGNHEGTGVGTGHGPGYGPGSDGGFGDGPFQCCAGGISEPIAIYFPEPAYSEEARKAKFSGIVLLWIVVDAQGIVRDVRIARHLGMGLDEEAEKTVRTWKFKPALRNNVPVPVQVQVEVSFRLF